MSKKRYDRLLEQDEFGPTITKNPAAVALGKMKSDKKAASSRRNGKLGGRPAKA